MLAETRALLSSFLAEVKQELLLELCPATEESSQAPAVSRKRERSRGRGDDDGGGTNRNGIHNTRPPTAAADRPLEGSGPLRVLTVEDWDVALHPIGELRPYLDSTAASVDNGAINDGGGGGPAVGPPPLSGAEGGLASYAKCRAAELPMRLQVEALQLRRHEHRLRAYMREIVQLSEFLALADRRHPAAVEAAPGHAARAAAVPPPPTAEAAAAAAAAAAAGLAALEALVSPSEAARRAARALERIAELEDFCRQQTEAKLRCAERMVLLSAMTRVMLDKAGRRQRRR